MGAAVSPAVAGGILPPGKTVEPRNDIREENTVVVRLPTVVGAQQNSSTSGNMGAGGVKLPALTCFLSPGEDIRCRSFVASVAEAVGW